ncbi:MAG TPA: HupE / UreJ protein [Chitinophagaceae bacterium]|nr:HupE / UreJ protein [Chitinophagaceae bacterium]
MNEFSFYFSLGWEHIISADALDHLLFLMALTAIYAVSKWKQVLILVTAFTIGHSATLVLSTLDILRVDSAWVEFLIPLTIVLTALFNLRKPGFSIGAQYLNYSIALLIGLIHGMGFANTIRMTLAKSQSIWKPLLGFNIGVELGQILVVTVLLLLNWILVDKLKLNRNIWVISLSVIAMLVAGWFCIERWPLSGS